MDEILNLIESVSEDFPSYSCGGCENRSAASWSLPSDLFFTNTKARNRHEHHSGLYNAILLLWFLNITCCDIRVFMVLSNIT